ITELRREHGTHERTGAGDRSEMMAEDDPLIRLYEVFAVVVDFARRGASVIKSDDARGDPFGIKSIADRVRAQCRKENVRRTNVLAAAERQGHVREGPESGDSHPDDG